MWWYNKTRRREEIHVMLRSSMAIWSGIMNKLFIVFGSYKHLFSREVRSKWKTR